MRTRITLECTCLLYTSILSAFEPVTSMIVGILVLHESASLSSMAGCILTVSYTHLAEACDVLEKADDFDLAVHDLIKKYATEHQKMCIRDSCCLCRSDRRSDRWIFIPDTQT